jgi:Bacterial cellulose synthase subunit
VHLCFPDSVDLTDVQVAQGAGVAEALALHAGYRPLLTSYSTQIVPDQLNVIIGTLDHLHNFISEQETKKISKGYVAIKRLPNSDKNGFALLVTGRSADDVDSAILSIGFVQVQFPDLPATTIREVILPTIPTFIRESPVESDKDVTFAELQKIGVSIKPLTTGGLSLELFFPGYFRTDSDAQVTINLHYLLQERTFHSSGAIVVRINGREILSTQSAARPSVNGTERALTFPVRMFEHGRNLLEVTTNDAPSASGSNDSLRVYGDSELAMPKLETGTKLPDLRVVRQTFYPFIGQPDGADLAVLLTERDQETINSAWTLLSRLAQSANTLFYAAQITFSKYDLRRHILVVGNYDHLPSVFRGIVDLRAFDEAHVNIPLAQLDSLSSGTNLKQLIERALDQRRVREEELSEMARSANLPQVGLADRDFGVLATAPPVSSAEGWSLVVTAFTSQNVLRRVQSLVQEPFWSQVKGDIDRWKDLPDSFQARVPGEGGAKTGPSLVELPLGERIDFRVWVGVVAGMLLLFVTVTVRLLGKFDQVLIRRQRRPQ